MKKKVVFIGAGSHSDALLPHLDDTLYEFIGYFDDKDMNEREGYKILGKIRDISAFLDNNYVDNFFITIGDNVKRKEIFDSLKDKYYDRLINIISNKSSILSNDSILGRGIFIGHNAFIGSKVKIYDNSIINTGAIVEHHTLIKGHCNISPNATINGFCVLNECVYVGSGSTLIQMMEICQNTIIGAGSVVVKSIFDSGTYVGVPARKIK